MIVITGAAGFIGSCLAADLDRAGNAGLVLVDEFSRKDKQKNLEGRRFAEKTGRDEIFSWLDKNHSRVTFVIHMGARTDTAEKDPLVFDKLNLGYSKRLWQLCSRYRLPLIYASSAATYGSGELGYSDDHSLITRLRPLNEYGISKHRFDIWALGQKQAPPFWAGLKFFNVYGPNEYHKGRMASAVLHLYRQITENGRVSLFRSHKKDVEDGQQKRDFVYIKDIASVCRFLMEKRPQSGIYNVGTGSARSFIDLALGTFQAAGKEPAISFTDTPASIRDNYQYYTCADISKLRSAGYKREFYSLENGVRDYVTNYLQKGLCY